MISSTIIIIKIITKTGDLNPNTIVKKYSMENDSSEEVHVYQLSEDQIVFASVGDLNDPLAPVVIHDAEGNRLAIPFSAQFLTVTEVKGVYNIAIPELTSQAEVEAWCKKNSYCVSIHDLPAITTPKPI